MAASWCPRHTGNIYRIEEACRLQSCGAGVRCPAPLGSAGGLVPPTLWRCFQRQWASVTLWIYLRVPLPSVGRDCGGRTVGDQCLEPRHFFPLRLGPADDRLTVTGCGCLCSLFLNCHSVLKLGAGHAEKRACRGLEAAARSRVCPRGRALASGNLGPGSSCPPGAAPSVQALWSMPNTCFPQESGYRLCRGRPCDRPLIKTLDTQAWPHFPERCLPAP